MEKEWILLFWIYCTKSASGISKQKYQQLVRNVFQDRRSHPPCRQRAKRSPAETVKRPTGGLLRDGRVMVEEEAAVQWKLRRKWCPNETIFKSLLDTAKMTMK